MVYLKQQSIVCLVWILSLWIPVAFTWTTTTTTTTRTTKRSIPNIAFPVSLRAAASSSSSSSSGIETGVIKGIREDSEEIDFGRCGVKLAEETIVRMTGSIRPNDKTVEWDTLDNIRKTIGLNPSETFSSSDYQNILCVLGSASAVEEYKDPGTGIKKEVIYAPQECFEQLRSKLDSLSAIHFLNEEKSSKYDLVVNVAGGNDLQVYQAMKTVEEIYTTPVGRAAHQVVWNSISYVDFPQGHASLVLVAVNSSKKNSNNDKVSSNVDEDDDIFLSDSTSTITSQGWTSGEIYQNPINGDYVALDEADVIEDFSEDWML
jgi:hypothetical protein